MREVLNETFIAPRVMWSPLERETPEQVLESLGKLEPALRTRAKELRKPHSEVDQALGAFLEYWADAACLCAKAVRDAAKKGRDPVNTGMSTNAPGSYLGLIGGMRLSAYPVVTMMLAVLPEADPVRSEAARHLGEGVEDLSSALAIMRHGKARSRCASGTLDGVSPRHRRAAMSSKPCSRQTWRRTAARVSLKVGRRLRYQALLAAAWRCSGAELRREQGDEGEQPEQAGRGAGDRLVRPLALGLDARGGRAPRGRWPPVASAGRTSGGSAAGPAPGRCRAALAGRTGPEGRAPAPSGSARWASRRDARRRCRAEIDGALALAVPARHHRALPSRARTGQHLGQVRQARALGPRAADWFRAAGAAPGRTGRRRGAGG